MDRTWQNSPTKSERECLNEHMEKFYRVSTTTTTTSSCSSGGDISLHMQSVSSKEIGRVLEKEEEGSIQSAVSQISMVEVPSARRLNKANKSVKHSPVELGSKLKIELCKYKNELKDYNTITKDLEEKYKKLNVQLNDMQQKHQKFVAARKRNTSKSPRKVASFTGTTSSSSCSISTSEYALKAKSTQVFRKHTACTTSKDYFGQSADNINMLSYSTSEDLKRRSKKIALTGPNVEPYVAAAVLGQKRFKIGKLLENKENVVPKEGRTSLNCVSSIQELCSVVNNVLHSNQKNSNIQRDAELKQLQATINLMQSEHEQFKTVIQEQQSCLQDYHTRCVQAQHIMQTQQTQIQKLNSNNHQLETEITNGIDQLRTKIDTKLKDIAQLPQMMRAEQIKYEKICKENSTLSDRLRTLQSEAHELKMKIEELGRRKVTTINRLRNAERDLKIFKNYNTALKHEKRKLSDELQKLKLQMDSVQNSSKRTLCRQREQSEKLRRDLQKRVFELELKLSRSKNSTTSLIQERDSLIAELQTQLNTLVHNFEVSQKHIRVLRRHIFAMSSGGGSSTMGVTVSSSGIGIGGSQCNAIPSAIRLNEQ